MDKPAERPPQLRLRCRRQPGPRVLNGSAPPVGRSSDGQTLHLALSELQGSSSLDLSVFDGAESDILQPEDIAEIAETLNSGGVAIAVVYEDRSLAAAAHAWRSAGGELLWSGGIAIDDLEHALAEPTNEEN